MTDAVEIHVVDSAILAVLIAGAWVEVVDVVVSFAEYRQATADPVLARGGLHLSARISTGAHHGDRIVARLSEIQAIRV